VKREKLNNPDANIDWEKTEHYVRIGALSSACVLLEDANLKGTNVHIRLLFEIRNAFIHNKGDMALNRNSDSLQDAINYIQDNGHKDLSDKLDSPYFSINGSVVKLENNLYYALRLCMI
jgi:hypothetical protein